MADKKQNEEDPLAGRFPTVPPAPEIPEAPKLAPKLPPHPDRQKPAVEPGSYNKMAIASTEASAFVMPIIVLSVGGWWLDQKLHHETAWLAMIGLLVGLVAGISGLLRIISRLQ